MNVIIHEANRLWVYLPPSRHSLSSYKTDNCKIQITVPYLWKKKKHACGIMPFAISERPFHLRTSILNRDLLAFKNLHNQATDFIVQMDRVPGALLVLNKQKWQEWGLVYLVLFTVGRGLYIDKWDWNQGRAYCYTAGMKGSRMMTDYCLDR